MGSITWYPVHLHLCRQPRGAFTGPDFFVIKVHHVSHKVVLDEICLIDLRSISFAGTLSRNLLTQLQRTSQERGGKRAKNSLPEVESNEGKLRS